MRLILIKNMWLLLLLAFLSCRKAITVAPPINALTLEKVYGDSASTVAALSNLYVQFARVGGATESYFTVYTALYADDVYPVSANATYEAYYDNAVTPLNATNAPTWRQLYFIIYSANLLMEQVRAAPALSADLQRQVEGEARFLRAFAYFLLVNQYGAVPLVLETDVAQTALLPRSAVAEVYGQVVADLQKAAVLLPQSYPLPEKVRANQWAARALLARVSLYTGQWATARDEAVSVIQSGLFSLPALEAAFKKGSPEAILQFWARDGFTWASVFVPSSGAPALAVTPELYNAFDPGDARRQQWIRTVTVGNNVYQHPYKFRNRVTTTGAAAEYGLPLRLAEQHLIAAEAYAQLGETTRALQHLNAVRARAGIAPLASPVSKEACLQLVMEERRRELFTEWGHRFFDLRRTGQIDAVLGAAKRNWKSHARYFPVPQAELLNNPALTQNEGY